MVSVKLPNFSSLCKVSLGKQYPLCLVMQF